MDFILSIFNIGIGPEDLFTELTSLNGCSTTEIEDFQIKWTGRIDDFLQADCSLFFL